VSIVTEATIFFLQFGAGFADFRGHERTVLNLKEYALGLLAVTPCGFLQFLGHRECIAGHRLALPDEADQLLQCSIR
jgi:hypothetical protein